MIRKCAILGIHTAVISSEATGTGVGEDSKTHKSVNV